MLAFTRPAYKVHICQLPLFTADSQTTDWVLNHRISLTTN